MKIVETDDYVLKVYIDESRVMETIALWFEGQIHYLTPLEAHQLSMVLEKLCNQTEYFRGFKEDESKR